jgi:hypothetical protein
MDPLAAALNDPLVYVRIGAAMAAPALSPETAIPMLVERARKIDPRQNPDEAIALALSLEWMGEDALPLVAAVLKDSTRALGAALAGDHAGWGRHLDSKVKSGVVPTGPARLLDPFHEVWLARSLRHPSEPFYHKAWRARSSSYFNPFYYEASRPLSSPYSFDPFYKVWRTRLPPYSSAIPSNEGRVRTTQFLLKYWQLIHSLGSTSVLKAKAARVSELIASARQNEDLASAANYLVESTISDADSRLRRIAAEALRTLAIDGALPLLRILSHEEGPRPGADVYADIAEEAGSAQPLETSPDELAAFLAGEALESFSDNDTALALANLAVTSARHIAAHAGRVLGHMSADVALPALSWAALYRPDRGERVAATNLLVTLVDRDPGSGLRPPRVGLREVSPRTLRWIKGLTERSAVDLPWAEDPAIAQSIIGNAIALMPDLAGEISVQSRWVPTLDRLRTSQTGIAKLTTVPPIEVSLPRHPQASFPRRCLLGERTALVVRLLPEASDGTAAPFDVPFVEGVETVDLMVFARSSAFDIEPDFCVLRTPRKGPSDYAVFQATPRRTGKQTIDVKFYLSTEPVGHLAVVTTVQDDDDGQAKTIPIEPLAEGALDRHPGASAVLFVKAGDNGHLDWSILRPGNTPKPLGQSPVAFQNSDIQSWTTSLSDLTKHFLKTDHPPEDLAGVLAQLKGLGSQLLKQLCPPQAIAELEVIPNESVVAIESNADWVPWELLAFGGKDGFWGDRFVLARAPLLSAPPNRVAAPSVTGPIDRATLVVGDEIASQPDHIAKRTFGTMAMRADKPLVQTTWETLSRRASEADILHFLCHGRGQPYHLSYGAGVGQKLYPGQAQDLGLRYGTVVFANACNSGVAQLMLAQFQSFGSEFYVAGARPFIGTLGPVPEEEAIGFAQLFYEGFAVQGLSAGQAMRRARQETRRRCHVPIWLFYSLYGNASVTRRWS